MKSHHSKLYGLARHLPAADKHENQVEDNRIRGRSAPKNGPTRNSNLAAPTQFLFEINTKKPIFSSLKRSVADQSGSPTGSRNPTGNNTVPRKPLINAHGYPYHAARLIDFDNHPSKKWYILFYAWDIGKEKLVRKRLGKRELNKIKDLNERRAEAKSHIRGLNDALQKGAYLESAKEKEEIKSYDLHGYKLIDALDYVHNYVRDIEQKSNNTLRQYRYTKNTIERFLIHAGINKSFLLRQLSPTFVHRLAEYMRMEKKLSNKTHNGVITILHSAIEKLRSLDHSLFKDRNPVKVQKLPEISRTHAAYNDEQLKKISELIAPLDAQLILFIRFLYFTLARPKEIKHIKVGHILIAHQRILMVGESAKNKKEKYVGIGPAFEKVIRNSGILNYPPEYYVFTSARIPGPVSVGAGYFYKRYKEHLKNLGFKKLNDRYTLYSFKHSGAIQLFIETKDLELVSKQCRHSNLAQTTTYLQELGLFTDFKGLEKWSFPGCDPK